MNPELDYKNLLDAIFQGNKELAYKVLDKIDKTNNYKTEFERIIELEINILNSLKIEFNEFEDSIAHYTKISTAKLLLDDSKFRMYSTNTVNDPKEGRVLFDYLRTDRERLREEAALHIFPFIACFTLNHDSLNQFRLYGKEEGKEATGVSIVLTKEFFLSNENKNNKNKLSLYRCIYLDPKGEVDNKPYLRIARRNELTFYREKSVKSISKLDEYYDKIKDIQDKVECKFCCIKEIMLNLYKKDINQNSKQILTLILLPLSYLIKHSAYQEEQECRILEFLNYNSKIKMDTNSVSVYMEYLKVKSEWIKNIYLSPGARKSKSEFENILGENIVKYSSNPFRNT